MFYAQSKQPINETMQIHFIILADVFLGFPNKLRLTGKSQHVYSNLQ